LALLPLLFLLAHAAGDDMRAVGRAEAHGCAAGQQHHRKNQKISRTGRNGKTPVLWMAVSYPLFNASSRTDKVLRNSAAILRLQNARAQCQQPRPSLKRMRPYSGTGVAALTGDVKKGVKNGASIQLE
jgi:hypothetical protein